MVAIKTIDLTKDFGDVVAVNGVNLEVYEGEIFALLGVNGAGKTTLIKMLSTILEPSSGDGIIYGKSITDPCLGWEKTEKLLFELADLL